MLRANAYGTQQAWHKMTHCANVLEADASTIEPLSLFPIIAFVAPRTTLNAVTEFV